MPDPAASARRIRIFVGDDHPVVRKGLCHIVAADPGLEVVGEAGTAEEVIDGAGRTRCDVVVLDLALPGATGFSVLKDLRDRLPDVPVLILSVAPEDQFGVRAIKAGAAGFVAKRSAPDQLVDAIRHVTGGSLYVSVETGRKLALETLRPPRREGANARVLSERELEVLRLLGGGMSGTAIAEALRVSTKTVSTYRRRMMAKLGLTSTASLIRYAVDHQLVDA